MIVRYAITEREPWPYSVDVERFPTNEIRTYVPEKTATHMIVNSGTTGHCACTGCGKAIDPWDAWCRHGGALLKGGWK